ncbi:alpha/beta fold hydrolase [Nonomuraea sp. NPDC059194]|uniref:alpha/beta fold hydrolase n=1 Tax=Nonomuraea sp. NPDC059194 TaxID=3346764 RepID=UPI00367F9EBD
MWNTTTLQRDGVRLVCRDSGGQGPAVLLLHGLAGQSREWEPLGEHLGGRYRLLALDQRGHGASEPRPGDTSRSAFVADAVAVIRELGVGPVVLVGQSLGGVTAIQTAAAHPDVVRGLLLVESGAAPGGSEVPGHIDGWLGSWPVPFATRQDAVRFFGDGPVGEGWASGLVSTADGLRPPFHREVVVDVIAAHTGHPNWADWAGITCPTTVVLGERGILPAGEVAEMRRLRPDARFVTVPDTGHDLHLERPAELAGAFEELMTRCSSAGRPG